MDEPLLLLRLQQLFGLLQKVFVFLLYSIHLVDIAVDQVGVHDILKIIVGIVKCLSGPFELGQNQFFFIFAYRHVFHGIPAFPGDMDKISSFT